MSTSPKYAIALRVIHWLMALIIIGLLCVGLIMGKAQGDLRGTLYFLHKSFGVLVLLLFCLRVFLRLHLGTPPLPDSIPAVHRKLATWGHYGLYCFMLAMPVSGILMSMYGGHGVSFFGLALPKLVADDKVMGGFFHSVHVYGGYTLIAVVTGHIGAVIYHRLKEHVNLLERMV